MKATSCNTASGRPDRIPGAARFRRGAADDNRDYHRCLANNLIEDMSEEDAWEFAIEFGWDGVIAQLGYGARHQIAHGAALR